MSDERINNLERRVIEGDLSAILQLHQERKRSGRERKHYSSPVFLIEPRNFTPFALSPIDARRIFIQIGDNVIIGRDRYGADRQAINLPTHFVRGIPYRGSVHFSINDDEEGWVPYSFYDGVRHDSFSIYRAGRFMEKPSDSAKRAILGPLTLIVSQWALENQHELLAAEVGTANNAIMRSDEKVQEAIKALQEVQSDLSEKIVREINAIRALESLR